MYTIQEMTSAAAKLVEAEAATDAADQALKAAKEKERVLREETLPGMMQELGVSEMTLTDGNKIKISQEVYSSVPEHRKEEAWGWLEKNGYGGLIKAEVSVAFGKGELEKAQELLDNLATELGITNGVLSREVHASTLKAFLKERLADPKTELTAEEAKAGMSLLSLEMFGARPVDTAKVSAPKAAKVKKNTGAVVRDMGGA
jgi:hypothetical protein